MLPRTRATVASAALLGVLLAATSCNDGGGSSNKVELTPDKALALAKATLDDTTGVALSLSTDDLPDGVTGVEAATGVGTHAPAFDGSITAVLSGQAFEVPVVAVGGEVYAQLPLTTGWQDVDPADYGAPDPADLMAPDGGFSALLAHTSGLRKGSSVRGGSDNSEVLTQYSGTVTAAVVKGVIPTASGTFEVVYTITDDSELREARLTGVFYPDSEPMTYSVTFDDYGTDKDISAP